MKSDESKKWFAVLSCMAIFLMGAGWVSATAINVPNFSFEAPNVGAGGAGIAIDVWNENGPDGTQGVAGNGWGGGQINLLNSDDSQIAWMNTQPVPANELNSTGLWQLLADTYTVGQSYKLTVALARGAWNPPDNGDQLQIRLWYDGATGATTIASTTITASELNWSNGGYLIDYTANLSKVQASDAWVGKQIGIWIVSTFEQSNGEGDWVIDNVRLSTDDTANNPIPLNGQTLVPVDTQLSWNAPTDYIPVGYNIRLGNDPNVTTILGTGYTGTTIDPSPAGNLNNGTQYYWRVDALEPNSPSPIVHTGTLWSFTTVPPDPIIIADPVSQTVASGTVINLSVTALNTTTYTWYFSADVAADAGDTNIGTGSTIPVTVDSISKEGWYYCVASSVFGSDTSAMARVMMKRLVGYWDFEGDLADSVAIGPTHNGSASDPNFVAGVPGLGGQAYKFYGDGRIVTIADSVDYYNFYPQGMTISCWVKNQNPAIWDTVCSKEYEREVGLNITKGFYLGRNPGGAGAFAIRPPEVLSADGLVTVADWHLLTAVHDPAGGVIRIYVDGVCRNQVTANPANFNAPNLAPLIFGAESTDGLIGSSSAAMDDMKIWNYALNSTEIARQYVDIMGGYICVGGNPTGDLSGDCQVTLADLTILAQNWLETNRVE